MSTTYNKLLIYQTFATVINISYQFSVLLWSANVARFRFGGARAGLVGVSYLDQ